ncbi:MAG TPA: PadR family transcriptional regulator [Acidimicrobiales bacterium]|nr:PadR family transcriptional regulator [Acidimicrobiales bacterium]
MPAADPDRTTAPRPGLSLAEHAVLALLVEHPAHGFAVARALGPQGDVGRAYQVARSAVYRAIDRLVDDGLVHPVGEEPGARAPARTIVAPTAAGRAADAAWIEAPVAHVRDVRTAVLVKLALLDRRGADPATLVAAQRDALGPLVERLAARAEAASGFERTLALWRVTSARAALAFLDAL